MLQIPTVSDRGIKAIPEATDVSCCAKVRIGGGVPLQHRLSVQRWADRINMWPNAVLAFSYSLGVNFFGGFVWILRNF